MKKRLGNSLKTFDEREILIRNQIYKHGLFILAALVLADLLLREKGVRWAQGQYNHLISLAAVFALVNIEFAIRGVYYGRYDTPVSRLSIVSIFVFRCAMRISTQSNAMELFNESIVKNGMLTQRGTYIIADYILIFAGACIVARAVIDIIRDLVQKTKGEKE